MELFNGSPKPRASMGTETRCKTPKDNIDLDMAAARRLGYGCHYGHFKADHPYTKDDNEARLAAKPKRAPQERPVYEIVCRGCGKTFTSPNRLRKYCDDRCKSKTDGAKQRAKLSKKQMEVQQ